MRRVLVVDDEIELGEELCEAIEALGHRARFAANGTAARAALAEGCDAVLLDLSMPETDGLELMQAIAASHPRPEIVLMSGFSESVLRSAARGAQMHGLVVRAALRKPLALEALAEVLLQAEPVRRPPGEHGERDIQQIADILERAIGAGTLAVMHQPKVATRSLAFTGTEALLPAVLPGLGLVPPPLQIEAARSRDGLLERLTCHVIRSSLLTCAEWRRRGFAGSVSVNMPVELLTAAGIDARLRALCDDAMVTRDALTLELTEDALYDVSAPAMTALTRLRMQGFGLALDDMGQRQSGLVQLANLPVTEVKIDADLIWQARSWQKAVEIVGSVADLARRVELAVTAEGVETTGDLNLVDAAGVDYTQGYLIQRKIEHDGLFRWLVDWPGTFVGKRAA